MDLYDFINEDKVDSSIVSNSMIEQSNNDNQPVVSLAMEVAA